MVGIHGFYCQGFQPPVRSRPPIPWPGKYSQHGDSRKGKKPVLRPARKRRHKRDRILCGIPPPGPLADGRSYLAGCERRVRRGWFNAMLIVVMPLGRRVAAHNRVPRETGPRGPDGCKKWRGRVAPKEGGCGRGGEDIGGLAPICPLAYRKFFTRRFFCMSLQAHPSQQADFLLHFCSTEKDNQDWLELSSVDI